MERRFFINVNGLVNFKFVEYREDGRRFSHLKNGTIEEYEGDGRFGNRGEDGKQTFVSHSLKTIQSRLERGVWKEITFAEAFPEAAPKTVYGNIW